LFTTRSTPPAAITEPCGRKYMSIRAKRTSSIALTGVSKPLNALKLNEWNRTPYSRLLLELGFPHRTEKSFRVKLSEFKESTGAASLSLFHRVIVATRPWMSLFVGSLKPVPITIKIAVADMSEMFALRGSLFAITFAVFIALSPSEMASINAKTVSANTPQRTSFSPSFAFAFEDLRSATSLSCSFSEHFSNASPQKTAKPPTEANNAITKTLIIYLLVTGVPFLIFVGGSLFFLIKIEKHERQNQSLTRR